MNNVSNLIIPEYDNRYGKLGHLWKKYNYDNIILNPSKSVVDVIIPKELIINELDTWSRSYTKSCGGLLSMKNPEKENHLNYCTNLTLQELFDLLVLHINNKSDRPRCPNCNNLIKFSGRFLFGYGNTQCWWDGAKKFCNHHCHAKYYNKLGLVGLGSLFNQASAQRAEFLTYGDSNDPCYFYIAKLSNDFKFGISCYYNDRQFWEPNKFKPIFNGTRLQVDNLEYWIKINLGDYKERLEFNKFMFKFRRAYFDSLKLINKNPS